MIVKRKPFKSSTTRYVIITKEQNDTELTVDVGNTWTPKIASLPPLFKITVNRLQYLICGFFLPYPSQERSKTTLTNKWEAGRGFIVISSLLCKSFKVEWFREREVTEGFGRF